MKLANVARAVGAEFVHRKYRSIVVSYSVVSLVFLAVSFWLTTISAWWWLLTILVTAFVLVGVMILTIIRIIIKRVRPGLTDTQSTTVSAFVDKLERVANNLQTPMFIIVYRVVRDIIRPGNASFVRTVAEDSTTLHTDFADLQRKLAQ